MEIQLHIDDGDSTIQNGILTVLYAVMDIRYPAGIAWPKDEMEANDIKTIQLTINEEFHSKSCHLTLHKKRKEGEGRQTSVRVTIEYVIIKVLYCCCATRSQDLPYKTWTVVIKWQGQLTETCTSTR